MDGQAVRQGGEEEARPTPWGLQVAAGIGYRPVLAHRVVPPVLRTVNTKQLERAERKRPAPHPEDSRWQQESGTDQFLPSG